MAVHVKDLEQEVRLVAHALLQTLVLGAVKVFGEDGPVVRMGALVDDDAGAFAGGEAADIGEALRFSNCKKDEARTGGDEVDGVDGLGVWR